MLKSFSYMFKAETFWKKFFLLFAFVLISNFFVNLAGVLAPLIGRQSLWYNICFALGYIVMFIPYGYSMDLLRTNLENKSESAFPSMDIFKCFKEGFKVVVSSMILIISVLLIIAGLVFASKVLSHQFGNIGFSFIYTFVFLLFLVVSFLSIAMCCRYVVKPSWLNFVNFKASCDIINDNVGKYFGVYVLTAVLAILVAIVSVLCAFILPQIGFVGFVLYNVVISLLWSYVIFVLARLFASAVNYEKI